VTGAPRPEALRSRPADGNALTVVCPWCKARVGEHCTSRARGRRLPDPHDSRINAAHRSAT